MFKIKYDEKEIEFDSFNVDTFDWKNAPKNLKRALINGDESAWCWVDDKYLDDWQNDETAEKVIPVCMLNASIYGYPWGIVLPVVYDKDDSEMMLFEFSKLDLNSDMVIYDEKTKTMNIVNR